MNISQAKVFVVGAVLGAVFGAAVLGPAIHFLLIGVVVAGTGAVLYRSRRVILGRSRDEKRLKA
jgi:uncharacterized membrane protein YfcA